MGKINKIKKLQTIAKDYGIKAGWELVQNKIDQRPEAQRKKVEKLINDSLKPSLRMTDRSYDFSDCPLISIIMPVYNVREDFLKEAIASVMAQSYDNWELCIYDGSDDYHEDLQKICEAYQRKDSRIKYLKGENKGISGNMNEAFELSSGEYIGVLDNDDVLHPRALFFVVKAIDEKKAEFVYTDEVTFEGRLTNIIQTNFKPDYAPETLLTNNYICHFAVYSRKLFEEAGKFKPEYDGSQDHEIFLRMTDKASVVYHIPKILYFWRASETSVAGDSGNKSYAAENGVKAVSDFLKEKGCEDVKVESSEILPTIYRMHFPVKEEPLISIIIPSYNHFNDLERCIDSIMASYYKNIEIVLIENNSRDYNIRKYYEKLQSEYSFIKVIKKDIPFNFSRLVNLGVDNSSGEYVVLLNNDTEVIEKNWINEMLMYAQMPQIGAVGAKLLYADDMIQHCYIITGAGEDRVAIHAGIGHSDEDAGYLGRYRMMMDVSSVTGACMMISRAKYEEANGFDENLAHAYNDVDFCLKLRKLGYRIIYTPYAKLYHYESQTRGNDVIGENRPQLRMEAAYMKEKWGEYLIDPYYNPNMSLYNAFLVK